jgi:hypothetical protein
MNIKEKVQDYKRREQDFNMKVESSAAACTWSNILTEAVTFMEDVLHAKQLTQPKLLAINCYM